MALETPEGGGGNESETSLVSDIRKSLLTEWQIRQGGYCSDACSGRWRGVLGPRAVVHALKQGGRKLNLLMSSVGTRATCYCFVM
jgi:hypothetical protein